MVYSVKEIVFTLQGEGAHSGRAAVFCRFSGCNLWSGREQHRETAQCNFCDTDFIGVDGYGGGKFATRESLARAIDECWGAKTTENKNKYVVCTGGEPLLQLDVLLIESLHALGFEVAVETNGTLSAPHNIDWICVSPKANQALKQTTGDELKLIFPQTGLNPINFLRLNFNHFYLQPMDKSHLGVTNSNTLQQTLDYCRRHPSWKLSLQIHKYLNIP